MSKLLIVTIFIATKNRFNLTDRPSLPAFKYNHTANQYVYYYTLIYRPIEIILKLFEISRWGSAITTTEISLITKPVFALNLRKDIDT